MGKASLPSGQFQVSLAYDQCRGIQDTPDDVDWLRVWKWYGPERVKPFLWLCIKNRLLTNLERNRRHLSDGTGCTDCGDATESLDHVLRRCESSSRIWQLLSISASSVAFFRGSVSSWILGNIGLRDRFGFSHWGMLFGIICWLIWKRRCTRVLGAGDYWTDSGLIVVVKRMVADFMRNEEVSVDPRSKRELILIGWNPPSEGSVKLNTDGSMNPSSGRASAGGLIRDAGGRWLGGFIHNIGMCSISKAELWALFDGLTLAWNRNFRRVQIEVDSHFVLEAVTGTESHCNDLLSLIKGIKDLLMRDWVVKLSHVYRQGNRSADFLASIGMHSNLGCQTLSAPPDGVLPILLQDLSGVSFPRLALM